MLKSTGEANPSSATLVGLQSQSRHYIQYLFKLHPEGGIGVDQFRSYWLIAAASLDTYFIYLNLFEKEWGEWGADYICLLYIMQQTLLILFLMTWSIRCANIQFPFYPMQNWKEFGIGGNYVYPDWNSSHFQNRKLRSATCYVINVVETTRVIRG